MSFYKIKDCILYLSVYVAPRSSKTEIVGLYGDFLKIKLKTAPVDNEANEELIRFLSEKFKIPKSNIEILSGKTQKKKVLSLIGSNPKQIEGILAKGIY